MTVAGLISVVMVAVFPSIIFGVLFFLHARGERLALLEISQEAFRQLNSRDAVMATEAKATEMYQKESLREQAMEFDRTLRADGGKGRKEKPQILRDEHGATYEVLAGMD